MLISVFWYVCGIRGFCQNKGEVKLPQEKTREVEVITKKINLNKKAVKEVKTERKIQCYTYLNSYISLGSKKNINSEVLRLEKFFNRFYNKNLSEDGVFGPEEKSAVEEFQKTNGLEVDGAVGPETQKIINAIYCVKTEKK